MLRRLRNFNLKALIMRDKNTKVISAIIILAVIIAYVLSITYIFPEKISVVYATFDGEKKSEVYTRENTVKKMIDEQKIDVDEGYTVTPCENHKVENGMKVRILQAKKTKAEISGKDKDFFLVPGTVRDNLEYNNVSYDEDDIIEPALDEEVTADTDIVVKDVRKEIKEKTETIEFKQKSVLDPSIPSGKVVKTEGRNGEVVAEYTTTYVNGEDIGTERTVKETISEVQDEGIRFGTSKTGQTGEVSVGRTFTGNTTAYYMGESARGAAGGHCVYGTCAVDPSVIPYGTKLYIEGYGFAVANDCGGAVKGNVVDLYMHSTSECISWGRRYMKVYVLG